MRNIKKMVAAVLTAAMVSSVPGMGIFSGVVAFAFEMSAVDGVVYETVYDIVEDYVYDTVEEVVYESEVNSDVFTLSIGRNDASVFGVVMENDVQPIIRNDRTMLPARFVAENLGASVSWDGVNRVVIIQSEFVEIKLTIDSAVATVNGVQEMLDSPAFIENDRTYTPVRFIAEKLGSTVEWDASTQTVIMSKPNPDAIQIPAPAPVPEEKIVGTLELNNYSYYYEQNDSIIEYNEGAIGGMHLCAEVVGPANVNDVLIARWSEEEFSEEQISSAIEYMINMWKQSGFEVFDEHVPFEFNSSHPVDSDELGKKMYVLLIGIDANCDAVGYAVVEEYIG